MEIKKLPSTRKTMLEGSRVLAKQPQLTSRHFCSCLLLFVVVVVVWVDSPARLGYDTLVVGFGFVGGVVGHWIVGGGRRVGLVAGFGVRCRVHKVYQGCEYVCNFLGDRMKRGFELGLKNNIFDSF
jgi:hypothetical protein